jgi:hypothetical protein
MKRRKEIPVTQGLDPGVVDDCPCTQVRCYRHGNCVECIRVHRTRQQHIPECLQDMFRNRIKELAALVECDVIDLRRTPAYWDERLGKGTPSRRKEKSPAKKPLRKRPTEKR